MIITDRFILRPFKLTDKKSLAKHANKEGKEYYIMEQERYDGTTPFKAAQAGAACMKSLKLSV